MIWVPDGFPVVIDGEHQDITDNWLVTTSDGARALIGQLVELESLIAYLDNWSPKFFDLLLFDPEDSVLLSQIHYFEDALAFNTGAFRMGEMDEKFLEPNEGGKRFVLHKEPILTHERIEPRGYKVSLSSFGL